ncbi:uncharacterized protein TRAVEDRAFT_52010 [Trametes versicolor FP-101664 SS1]|uniref:uncharacterized protein n=1 Tax=Trametes versicolor (strain FP-101664) TaxID=717944 RepID=UPI00046242FE|nr:uncharacterized protein TRAVEDRAFT_52010 [Trametes versicolor FP-101664 SS1]EIW54301.1 hypothetical protein TRAVEDRAFT_52010 [Trametes versicolor FP-101664 SS1]
MSTSSTCPSCNTPNHASHIPNPHATKYHPGDICAIHEHVSTAVYHFFEASNKVPGSRAFSSTITWGSFSSLGKWSKKEPVDARPGIILDETDIPPPPTGVRVCLSATLDGETRDNVLPKILQLICVPLSPHALARQGRMHYHTIPEWPIEGAWLIASPFVSHGRVDGRWEDRRPQGSPEGSFKLSPQDTASLIRLCNRKLSQWEAACLADENLADKSWKAYKESLQNSIQGRERRSQDAAPRADAGPSRSPHENFYPARAEPAKQLVTFKWLTKKHGKKGLKGAKRAATAASVAPQVSVAQATLETADATRAPSPAASTQSKPKHSPRNALRKLFLVSKSTLNLPG